MEHNKSGIRVSHGTARPAAGIKMTSGQAHVLSLNGRRDRTKGSTSAGDRVLPGRMLQRHSDDPLWKFLQFRCSRGYFCARDVDARTRVRLCACTGTASASASASRRTVRDGAREIQGCPAASSIYPAGPDGTGSMRFIAPERLQLHGEDRERGWREKEGERDREGGEREIIYG